MIPGKEHAQRISKPLACQNNGTVLCKAGWLYECDLLLTGHEIKKSRSKVVGVKNRIRKVYQQLALRNL